MKSVIIFCFLTISLFGQTWIRFQRYNGAIDSVKLSDVKEISFITITPNLASGLIASYSFDNNLTDSSSFHNNGVLSGTQTFISGIHNRACNFDGSTFITIPNSSSLQSPINGLSYSFWVKVDGYDNGFAPVLAKSNNTELGQYSIEINLNEGPWFWIGGSLARFQSPLTSGIWYHIAFTWNGTTAKYYQNGIFIGEMDLVSNPTVDTMPLLIGKHTPTTTEFLYGALDDLKIYNRALNEVEIQLLSTQK